MNIDINKLENILIRAHCSCSDEATKADIEQFLGQLKIARNSGDQMPQKIRSLTSDIVFWVNTCKVATDLITLWMHHK